MSQQHFKIVTPPQPLFVYGQDIPGVVHSQVGEPDLPITGTVIGMQYLVCEDDRYRQTWQYQVEFRRVNGCPVYENTWYDEADLSEPVSFTAPMPEPVVARTHDEMQRDKKVYPLVVVEFSRENDLHGFNTTNVDHNPFFINHGTLVEAAHAAHRARKHDIEFVMFLRHIRRVTGFPKGTQPDSKLAAQL